LVLHPTHPTISPLYIIIYHLKSHYVAGEPLLCWGKMETTLRCHQTWLAGESPINESLELRKSSINGRWYLLATFDIRRVNQLINGPVSQVVTYPPCWGEKNPTIPTWPEFRAGIWDPQTETHWFPKTSTCSARFGSSPTVEYTVPEIAVWLSRQSSHLATKTTSRRSPSKLSRPFTTPPELWKLNSLGWLKGASKLETRCFFSYQIGEFPLNVSLNQSKD
jgi:hypothetical protein